MLAIARQRAKKRRALRIYFATDIHGSDGCFRKFLAAAKVYQADAVILGGDFAGKALVPILRPGRGRSTRRIDGQSVTRSRPARRTGSGRHQPGRLLPRAGSTRPRARRDCEDDPEPVDRPLPQQIAEPGRSSWCRPGRRAPRSRRCAASSRPATTTRSRSTRCSSAHRGIECPEGRLCDLGPVLMASLGDVTPTPWNTERETPRRS